MSRTSRDEIEEAEAKISRHDVRGATYQAILAIAKSLEEAKKNSPLSPSVSAEEIDKAEAEMARHDVRRATFHALMAIAKSLSKS